MDGVLGAEPHVDFLIMRIGEARFGETANRRIRVVDGLRLLLGPVKVWTVLAVGADLSEG